MIPTVKYRVIAGGLILFVAALLLIGEAHGKVVKILLPDEQMKIYLESEKTANAFLYPPYPKWGDYTFDSPKPKFNELTREELALLFGYADESGHKFIPWMNYLNFVDNPKYPWFTDEHNRWAYDNVPNPFWEIMISPITGRPLEFQHGKFSRGNAYIKVVMEPEYLEILRNYREEEGTKLSLDEKVYYIRLYGEKQVIWESLLFSGARYRNLVPKRS